MRARATLIATAGTLFAMAGCRDLGLSDRNLALEDAAHRAPDALVQAVHPEHDATRRADGARAHGRRMEAAPVRVGEQTFQVSGRPVRLGEASLRPVGTGAAGGSFSAAAWDQPPYDRLYRSHPGGTHIEYLPVHDAGDAAGRLEAGKHALESGGSPAH